MKCINCQHTGMGKLLTGEKKLKYICFQIKTDWWGKSVLNTEFNCPYFEQLIDIGDRMELTYPIDILNEISNDTNK